MSNMFATRVAPMFETTRVDFLSYARRRALELFNQRGDKPITISDLRAHGVSPPENVDPRVMGAVFNRGDWERVGYVGSVRSTSHGRPVAQFVRRDA